MPFVYVCRTADVPPAECREFNVAGRSVLICEDAGAYYAHSAACPHQLYSLDGSCVRNGEIACPWHGYTFDVVTGANAYPVRVYPVGPAGPSKAIGALQTFAIEIRDGAVYVDVTAR